MGSQAIEVLVAIIASLLASYLFWYFTFVKTGVKIEFYDNLERKRDSGQPEIRVMFRNTGKRDLIELRMIAVLAVNMGINKKRRVYSAHFKAGNDGEVPVLWGKTSVKKNDKKSLTRALTLYPNESAYEEFRKNYYPSRIKKRAVSRELSLNDIMISKSTEIAAITVYVFGNDSKTGARKVFHKRYSITDVMDGEFDVSAYSFMRK